MMWKLLEKRPYTSRYRSYGVLHARLKDDSSHPELVKARANTADLTKKMMRRLSKENTKQYGRHLPATCLLPPSCRPAQHCPPGTCLLPPSCSLR